MHGSPMSERRGERVRFNCQRAKREPARANGGGPRPWMDAPLSHQVTKVHTFSFFATPVILPIVAQTGHKQGKHASFPPEVSSPHFLVFSYSAKGKSHFKRSEKNTHLLAPCDHNCARRAHKPAFPDPILIRRPPAPRRWTRPVSLPIDHVSLSSILHGG